MKMQSILFFLPLVLAIGLFSYVSCTGGCRARDVRPLRNIDEAAIAKKLWYEIILFPPTSDLADVYQCNRTEGCRPLWDSVVSFSFDETGLKVTLNTRGYPGSPTADCQILPYPTWKRTSIPGVYQYESRKGRPGNLIFVDIDKKLQDKMLVAWVCFKEDEEGNCVNNEICVESPLLGERETLVPLAIQEATRLFKECRPLNETDTMITQYQGEGCVEKKLKCARDEC